MIQWSYAGIRSDNRMISDLLRLGDAWTYEPYESVDITFQMETQ